MKPWPSLAEKAFCLKTGTRKEETIFYFDSAPSNSGLLDKMLPAAPVVVLIHGLGDEADSWRHIIPLLDSRGYRVLAVDLPGFGRSITPGKVNLKNHAAAVSKLLEALVQPFETSGKPVFLAGSSMGALVAEMLALEKPGLAKGLILIGGSIPGGPSNPGPLVLAKLLFSRKWYRAYRENPEGAWESLRPYYADLENLPKVDKEFLKERVMARVESPSQEAAFFQTQNSLIWTYLTAPSRFARLIRNYSGKILLLWGDKDRIIPLSSAEIFKTLRSDIELEIVSGAGHLPQQEKPEETARLMANFMDRC
jgi:pimeloyl-ACP methyl ester carboxylesterase